MKTHLFLALFVAYFPLHIVGKAASAAFIPASAFRQRFSWNSRIPLGFTRQKTIQITRIPMSSSIHLWNLMLFLTASMMACCLCACENDDVTCGGVNPFWVYSGNAVRNIRDIPAIPKSTNAPIWGRWHNTIPRRRDALFGNGGCWRHQWQYDLLIDEDSAEFIYPSGVRRAFWQKEGGKWEPFERYNETMAMREDKCEITTEDGSRLAFTLAKDLGTKMIYRLESVADAQDNTTYLNYNKEGDLIEIRGSNGGTLAIIYGLFELSPAMLFGMFFGKLI
jgi:hypothetical protein